MSDITVVQLIDAERRREQSAQQMPGIIDCLTLPLAFVVLVCVILCMSVVAIVAVLFGQLRKPLPQTNVYATGHGER